MNDSRLLNTLKELIVARYGSLESPDFSFVENAFRRRPYAQVERELARIVRLADDTDGNDDVSFGYLLESGERKWILRVSMVGPYAMFGALLPGGRTQLLTGAEPDLSDTESRIVGVLAAHALTLLDAGILRASVPLKLFNTPVEQVRVFQALFTDTDILPF